MTTLPAFTRPTEILTAEDAQRARETTTAAAALAATADSQRTLDAYGRAQRAFEVWSRTNGHGGLPCDAAALGAYLAAMHGRGLKVASLNLARAAVVAWHRNNGHAFDSDHEGVRRVLRAARKADKVIKPAGLASAKNRGGQSLPILDGDMLELLDMLAADGSGVARRDAALSASASVTGCAGPARPWRLTAAPKVLAAVR